jgi:hypothetical protein
LIIISIANFPLRERDRVTRTVGDTRQCHDSSIREHALGRTTRHCRLEFEARPEGGEIAVAGRLEGVAVCVQIPRGPVARRAKEDIQSGAVDRRVRQGLGVDRLANRKAEVKVHGIVERLLIEEPQESNVRGRTAARRGGAIQVVNQQRAWGKAVV